MHIKLDEFDSKIFGIKVGKIELEGVNFKLNKSLNYSDFDYLTVKIPYHAVSLMQEFEDYGFRFCEIAQKFVYHINTKPLFKPIYSSTYAKEDELEKIFEISRQYFYYDRYHTDSFLDKSRVDLVYKTWIKNAFYGIYGDKVLVDRDSNDLVRAFTVLRVDKTKVGVGHIDLTASSIGWVSSGLLELALTYLNTEHNCSCINTATQLYNTASISSLKRAGFRELGMPYFTLSRGKND